MSIISPINRPVAPAPAGLSPRPVLTPNQHSTIMAAAAVIRTATLFSLVANIIVLIQRLSASLRNNPAGQASRLTGGDFGRIILRHIGAALSGFLGLVGFCMLVMGVSGPTGPALLAAGAIGYSMCLFFTISESVRLAMR